jgi:hypothetical protein
MTGLAIKGDGILLPLSHQPRRGATYVARGSAPGKGPTPHLLPLSPSDRERGLEFGNLRGPKGRTNIALGNARGDSNPWKDGAL